MENPKQIKSWRMQEAASFSNINLLHKCTLTNSFHISVLSEKSGVLWLLRSAS